MKQEVHWVPEGKSFPVEREPFRVWTIMGNQDPEDKPKLPISPVHLRNAFMEDKTHDWKWRQGKLRYYSRVADHSVWVLCEFND